MRVKVDLDRCLGAGNCAMTAPEIFDQRDEDGLVSLLVDAPTAEQEEAVRQAALTCPAGAIDVIDE
jgi:ferredoxin